MQMKIWTSKYLLSENRCPDEGRKNGILKHKERKRVKFCVSYIRGQRGLRAQSTTQFVANIILSRYIF